MLLIVNYSELLLRPWPKAASGLFIEAVATQLAAQLGEETSETFVSSFCPYPYPLAATGNVAPNVRADSGINGVTNNNSNNRVGLFIALHKLTRLREVANSGLASWLVEFSPNYNRQGEELLQLAGLIESEGERESERETSGSSFILASPRPVYLARATNPNPLVASSFDLTCLPGPAETAANQPQPRITQWGDAGTVVLIPPTSPVLSMFLGHALTHLLAEGDTLSPIYVVSHIQIETKAEQSRHPTQPDQELIIKLAEWD